jgi:aquaporin Z
VSHEETPPDHRVHHAEAAIDGALLGCFMISACTFGTLLWHPASPTHALLGTGIGARVPMGIIMGLTSLVLVHSPWGRRSGAHMNPAFTLTMVGLGRMAPRDAVAYVAAQFTGGALGVLVSWLLLGDLLAHPDVRFVATRPGVPGVPGVAVAFVAELAMAAALMTLVLETTASPRWARWTGFVAAGCVATFIALEAPLSGMSLNPARTVSSALWSGDPTAVWLYFVAPLAGMTGAALAHVARHRRTDAACAKLVHGDPCHFCEYIASRHVRSSG